jgi:hypothetical protein
VIRSDIGKQRVTVSRAAFPGYGMDDPGREMNTWMVDIVVSADYTESYNLNGKEFKR